jgi:hypothetical protein
LNRDGAFKWDKWDGIFEKRMALQKGLAYSKRIALCTIYYMSIHINKPYITQTPSPDVWAPV